MQTNNKIVIHACCGICSGYPISYLKDMGYDVVVYFYNPNIYPEEEYIKRLEAQKKICEHFQVKLVIEIYEPEKYFEYVKGFENEPERGLRCDKCFEMRLKKTAEYAKSINADGFTTSLVISPHKNFAKISDIGERIAKSSGIKYLAIDFKKKDGFLKTNRLSKELEIYRQNYCGCKFSKVER